MAPLASTKQDASGTAPTSPSMTMTNVSRHCLTPDGQAGLGEDDGIQCRKGRVLQVPSPQAAHPRGWDSLIIFYTHAWHIIKDQYMSV